MLNEGQKMPYFELFDSNKNTVISSNFIGTRLVIYFYPRDFTPGCTTEADEFTKNYSEFKKKKIDVIGISTDDVDKHKKFCEKINIPYKLLSDTNATVARKFKVFGKKKFMGKVYEGITRTTFLVNEQGIIFKIFNNVKPRGHAKTVLGCFY